MRRLLGVFLGFALAWQASAEPATILFIGHKRDHPHKSHEYLAASRLLARCVERTPGVRGVVSDGWPKDAASLEGVRAICLYTSPGGNLLLHRKARAAAEKLLARGVGLVALHWSTAAEGKDVGQPYLEALGGRFSFDFSGLRTDVVSLRAEAKDHPILRGWKPLELRDEIYLDLRFMPKATPLLIAELPARPADPRAKVAATPKRDQVVAWAYERPGGGRSFGCTLGHFHENFGVEGLRRLIVNGILWTAKIDPPANGAAVPISPADLDVPPDTRENRLP